MKLRIPFLLFTSVLLLTSCSNEDDAGQIIIGDENVEAPVDYTFTRDGNSTVSFSGQTTRIAMSTELASSLTDFDNATEQSLLDMFANENNPFSSSDLNESGKSIKSKVAASADYFATNTALSNEIKAEFETIIRSQAIEVSPNQNVLAEAGTAGQIADGTSTRYVDAKGLELNQVFAKSLIGGLMLDQTLNNYLSVAVLDEGSNRDNNKNGIIEEGESYTTMEHKWDEAYGYLYGASQNPANPNATLGDDSFLNNYLGRLESDSDFEGIAAEVYNAFKLGRAAIVAANYNVRDEQADIIKEKLSLIPAVRAAHYLMAGKTAIEEENWGGAFHDLSEGYGFIYSLQFTRNPQTDAPYFSRAEVLDFIDLIMNEGESGLWDANPATLESIAVEIAGRFNFTVEQAID